MRVLLLILCLEISSSAALSFSPMNNETISAMTIADTSDELFIAGGNIIYKLSANLSQLMNVAVSNDTGVSVRGLSVSNGGQYIVACLTTGSCIGYDVISLTSTMSNISLNEPGAAVFNSTDPVVMLPGAVEGIVHTGTAAESGQEYRMSLGQYKISLGSIMTNKTKDYILQRSSDFNTRIFKAGLIDNFTYYIVEDDASKIRILRVCNETESDTFKALYEVQLICGDSAVVFAGASILDSFSSSSNTLVLTVRSPDSAITRFGRVCTYSISDINTAMDNGRTACANGESREAVWDNFPNNYLLYRAICSVATECNLVVQADFSLEAIRGDNVPLSDSRLQLEHKDQFSEFISSVTVQVEGESLIFIGTRIGLLLKYNFVSHNFSNPERYNKTDITDESIISLQWSLGSDYVYGLTSRQVIAILVEDCQSFRDCTSCTGLGDPLCGWCSIENKCSRRSECSNYNETRRWIRDQSMCIANFAISPNAVSTSMNNWQFIITANQLPPPLDDESYYCVFGEFGSSLLEGNLIPGVTFTDLTCDYSFTVEQFSNGSDDTAVVDFSLRSNLTNINFITIDDGFRFFNCSTHARCWSCLSSNNLCGWCLYDKKCTSSSDQCRVSTDWINTGSSNSESCPLILSHTITNGVSEYQQPVGVSRNLSLNAINLPAPNENNTYQCVISYNGLTSMIEAEYTGANSLVCVPGVDDFTQVEDVNNACVSVLWSGPGMEYYLETEETPLTVILYNCSALAGVCPSCLSESELLSLDCGWCPDSRTCVVTESCSTFIANSGGDCLIPQITMVNPNSGPYQGGTDVTITGTELGFVFEDIINVTIGGALCTINSDSYQSRVGLRCRVPSNNSIIAISDVSIAVHHDGRIETAILTGGFRYAEVIITDFSPRIIPQSGNVTISIFGRNFDISNPLLAEIRLAGTLCNQERAPYPDWFGCGEIWCPPTCMQGSFTKTLNSTFVQCVAGSRQQPGVGPVVFIIDNSITQSEGDFTYTSDPQVFSVRNNEIIKSGGTKLVFIGINFDVVPITLDIDIVNISTSRTVLTMHYNINCTAESDSELSCAFPAILPDLLDGIMNGTLQLTYSLVAASVPGLDNLHLMSQFAIGFVDDPVIHPWTQAILFQPNTNITISGTGFDTVDKSEVTIRIGKNETCNITSYSATAILCVPPQSGMGAVDIVVYFGEYLNYTVGRLQYPTTSSDTTELLTTTNIIIGSAVIAVIVLTPIIIIIICVVRKRKKTYKLTIAGNKDFTTFASPPYGTNLVYGEPEMNESYNQTDGSRSLSRRSTVLNHAPSNDYEGNDINNFVKMNPSFEIIQQAVTESGAGDTGSTFRRKRSTDEYDHLPTEAEVQRIMNTES